MTVKASEGSASATFPSRRAQPLLPAAMVGYFDEMSAAMGSRR
jgi:hypothetical protein